MKHLQQARAMPGLSATCISSICLVLVLPGSTLWQQERGELTCVALDELVPSATTAV